MEEKMNFYIWFATALVPLIVGFVWYNPKVLGKAWMESAGMTMEQTQGLNMPMVFGLTYLFGLFVSLALSGIVVHQMGMGGVFANDQQNPIFKAAMAEGLHNFRTYKHGLLHGVLTAVFLVLPIVGISAMFERKGFKYIAIHVGYWMVCLGIMGAIICHWL
jgi:Protein of unknown function (DUF1761)